jgi:hypothetical protein
MNVKIFDTALERGMLTKQANQSGMPWRELGLKIKSVFGDNDIAWNLFDKWYHNVCIIISHESHDGGQYYYYRLT